MRLLRRRPARRVGGLGLRQQGDQGGRRLAPLLGGGGGRREREREEEEEVRVRVRALAQLDPAATRSASQGSARAGPAVQILDRLAAVPAEVGVKLVDLPLTDRGVGRSSTSVCTSTRRSA